MTTKLITLSEYRKNLSKYTKVAQKENIMYIVLVHGKPVIEVKPARQELFLESNEYLNESWDTFQSPEEFMEDLKKHHKDQRKCK